MESPKQIPVNDSKASLITHGKNLQLQINLLIGLWSLLRLQYDQEGHMNNSVVSHLDQELFMLEEQQSQYMSKLIEPDLPF